MPDYVICPYYGDANYDGRFAAGNQIGTLDGNPVKVTQDYLQTQSGHFLIGAYKVGGLTQLMFMGPLQRKNFIMRWNATTLDEKGRVIYLRGHDGYGVHLSEFILGGSVITGYGYACYYDSAFNDIEWDITVFDSIEACHQTLKRVIDSEAPAYAPKQNYEYAPLVNYESASNELEGFSPLCAVEIGTLNALPVLACHDNSPFYGNGLNDPKIGAYREDGKTRLLIMGNDPKYNPFFGDGEYNKELSFYLALNDGGNFVPLRTLKAKAGIYPFDQAAYASFYDEIFEQIEFAFPIFDSKKQSHDSLRGNSGSGSGGTGGGSGISLTPEELDMTSEDMTAEAKRKLKLLKRMETFGKYDKKSLMTGVVIGQGLKGRAHAPTDPAPAGFPSDLWRDAKDRADAAMKEIAAPFGNVIDNPDIWEFNEEAFCFGLAVGRSLEGWEIDGAMDLLVNCGVVMILVHLEEPQTVTASFWADWYYYESSLDGSASENAAGFIDWGDGAITRTPHVGEYFEGTHFYSWDEEVGPPNNGDFIITLGCSIPMYLNHPINAPVFGGGATDKTIVKAVYIQDGAVKGKLRGLTDDNYPTGLGGYAELKDIHLNGVRRIGAWSFSGCEKLESLVIPDSVVEMDMDVFDLCPNLKSVTIGNGLPKLITNQFGRCGLESITIPKNIASLETWTFYGCDNLLSVTILGDAEGGIQTIPRAAFEARHSLKSVSLPDSVTSIGYGAFNHCEGLQNIRLGENLTSIGDYAFQYCSSLESITLPSNLKSIGYSAFSSCEKLKSVIFPNGMTTIGAFAFDSCFALESVMVPPSIKTIPNDAFVDCKNLKNVVIAQGVTSIGEESFYGCESLTNVTIPESVISIGRYAFRPTNLSSVTINRNCSVANKAFPDNCQINYY